VQGRGKFYEEVGALRDVVQNHLLQVVAHIAMEPPTGKGAEPLRDERAKVLRAIRPLASDDLIRGQFDGYRQEPGVAPDSQVETVAVDA
jgi:glucose-6-phosphate 1-dehydrogenase